MKGDEDYMTSELNMKNEITKVLDVIRWHELCKEITYSRLDIPQELNEFQDPSITLYRTQEILLELMKKL